MKIKRICGMDFFGSDTGRNGACSSPVIASGFGHLRVRSSKNTLTHAARAGARTAVVTPGLTPNTSYTGCSSTDAVVQSTFQGLDIIKDKANISTLVQVFSPGATTPKTVNAASGDSVKVTVTLPGFSSIVPNFIPLPTTISGNTAMRYE